MRIASAARAALDHTRRWGAIALFRLTSIALRGSVRLYQRGLMSRIVLRAILSVARILERTAALLVLGFKRQPDQREGQSGSGS